MKRAHGQMAKRGVDTARNVECFHPRHVTDTVSARHGTDTVMAIKAHDKHPTNLLACRRIKGVDRHEANLNAVLSQTVNLIIVIILL